MIGETILGAWATVGVLTEKGMPKVSSTGKNFVIWKLSTLDTSTVPLFLFGDAYIRHWKESAGSIMAVLNAKVRRDDKVKLKKYWMELLLFSIVSHCSSL